MGDKQQTEVCITMAYEIARYRFGNRPAFRLIRRNGKVRVQHERNHDPERIPQIPVVDVKRWGKSKPWGR
jgi:hypothetical protein